VEDSKAEEKKEEKKEGMLSCRGQGRYRQVHRLTINSTEPEESDEDMGFGLFD
jgi:ribosomal protein L12E/L44/L45/RPP1/RPP2